MKIELRICDLCYVLKPFAVVKADRPLKDSEGKELDATTEIEICDFCLKELEEKGTNFQILRRIEDNEKKLN